MTRLRNINIGIAGFGTVGGGLIRILTENAGQIAARSGCSFTVKTVVVRDPSRPRAVALPPESSISMRLEDIVEDPSIDVAVELMGGIEPARTYIAAAMEAGKHVVTANKALLARHGTELMELAERKGVRLLYEASVAGGIPIIQTMKESLAGNEVSRIEGILNGTGNFILSEMTSNGRDFDSALLEAQRLGYAEADPTLDIDGFDTAHKLSLLIRLAWGADYPFDRMPIKGIRGLSTKDIEYAREFGYRIKMLGRAEMTAHGLDAGVFPVLVKHTYLLARVGGAYNAVRIEGNAVGTLFMHGLGAGAMPTGSAVVSDVIAAVRGTMPLNSGFVSQVPKRLEPLPAEDSVSPYYLRFTVRDVPGVLHALTGALAARGIGISQVVQKNDRRPIKDSDDFAVPLILMIHGSRAKDVENALTAIARTGFLLEPPVAFRVME